MVHRRLERQGIRIMNKQDLRITARLSTTQKRMIDLHSEHFNINTSEAVREILDDYRKIKSEKKQAARQLINIFEILSLMLDLTADEKAKYKSQLPHILSGVK